MSTTDEALFEIKRFFRKWQHSDHTCLSQEKLSYHKYIVKQILQRLYLKFRSSWIYSKMEIAKYFERISKKRDLSNNSSNEEA